VTDPARGDLGQLRDRLIGDRTGGVIGVDGHSSSGKTTFAGRLADLLGGAVLHTDDLAWYHSVFDWGDLLLEHVLTPFRAGRAVDYRPPGWVERDRTGSVRVPAGPPWLVVEGVGCTRRVLGPLYDATVWVETPADVRRARDTVRVAAGEISPASYDAWMVQENAVLAADRAWERADLVITGR
jgi:hypothetical protein